MHVIQRGHNRSACFHAPGDRDLMTPASPEACSALMRNLGQRYVRQFNRRYARSGTLWEGRFRSCLTDSAHYVLACYRYIELNPVRAGLATHPEAFEWSSYSVNAGKRQDPLITPHVEFLALGHDPQRAYVGLFEEALQPRLGSEHLL